MTADAPAADRHEHFAALAAAHGLDVVVGAIDDTGWDFLVAHATDEHGAAWILRVPRRADAAIRSEVEAALLTHLRPELPVAIPDWRVHSPRLIAYRRLPGEPLIAEDPIVRAEHCCPTPSEKYFRTLGTLLARLHGLDTAALAPLELPRSTADVLRTVTARELAEAREEFDVPEHLVRRWEDWLADERYWPRPDAAHTRLVHHDPHPAHTLVDDAERVVGLLDWTDAALGDPAVDFAPVQLAFGDSGMGRLLHWYRQSGGVFDEYRRRHLAELVAFRSSISLGRYGLEIGHDAYVTLARDRLRSS